MLLTELHRLTKAIATLELKHLDLASALEQHTNGTDPRVAFLCNAIGELLGLLDDATESLRIAARAAEQMERLQIATGALSAALTPVEVSKIILDGSLSVLGASAAAIGLVTEDGSAIEIMHVGGSAGADLERSARLPFEAPLPLVECVRTGEPTWLERATEWNELRGIAGVGLHEGAWAAIPLIVNGRVIGGIDLRFDRPRRFDAGERELAVAFARHCTIALERACLFEAERRARRQIALLVREAEQAREAADEANRLKDEFLATMSHELRTPLTAILGWARMLRTMKTSEATRARALETIERNASLQARLIDDLLDTSRIITGKLRIEIESVDLASVIQAAIDVVSHAASAKEIKLVPVAPASPIMVDGDPSRLQQIMWNLLSNAIKFTPKGGVVEIRLDRAGPEAHIRVSDTGQGIGLDFLPYVFDRFRQADSSMTRAHGGLGLGLSIVRALVDMHGGSVHAASDGPGRGSSFLVALPLPRGATVVASLGTDLQSSGSP